MSDSLPLQDLKFLIGTLKSGLSELGSVVDLLEELHDHLDNDRYQNRLPQEEIQYV